MSLDAQHQLKPWFGAPPLANPPMLEGYEMIAHERMRVGRVAVLGIALIPVWYLIFELVVAALGGQRTGSLSVSLTTLPLAAIALVLVVVVHEGIHGLAALAFGGRPSFGAGPGFFYTTTRKPLQRSGYAVVALGPLAVINGGSIAVAILWPSLTGWLLAVSLINVSGVGGDLWMAYRILRHPRRALFVDLADGFAVYRPLTVS